MQIKLFFKKIKLELETILKEYYDLRKTIDGT